MPQQGGPTGPIVPPRVTARRRRPAFMALGLALIAAGGAGAAVLVLQVGHRTDVVTVVREVPVGQVVTKQDLGKASIALDPAVHAVEASDLRSVLGKRAAVGLKAGSLLSSSQVTDQALVKAGEQLVPVGLKPEQVPASTLSPGQPVVIVRVPGQGGEVKGSVPDSVRARVVKVGKATPGTGVQVVDVAASSSDGPALAGWVSTGNVRLLIDPQGGA